MSLRLWLGLALSISLGACGKGDGGGSAGSSGTGGSTGSTGAPNCDPLEPASGSPVTITVRNNGPAVIYLQQLGCGPAVELLGPGDDTPAAWRFPDCQLAACSDLLMGSCQIACADCVPGIIRLDMGAEYVQTWQGTVFADEVAPMGCEPMGCAPQCHVEQAAPLGTYTVRTNIWEQCPYNDPDDCECVDGGITCALFGGTFGNMTPVPRTAQFTSPLDGEVSLNIL